LAVLIIVDELISELLSNTVLLSVVLTIDCCSQTLTALEIIVFPWTKRFHIVCFAAHIEASKILQEPLLLETTHPLCGLKASLILPVPFV
jgi:hypothetical protein